MRYKRSSCTSYYTHPLSIKHGIDLKEVVDLFLRSTQVDLSLAALLKDRDDAKILQQT